MAAEKFLQLPANGDDPQSISGSQAGGPANGGRIMALRDNGTIDPSMYGPEVASPDVETGTANEALAAGDLVNTYNSTGTAAGVNTIRKAVASAYGTRATGFVVAAAAAGATGVVVYKTGAPNPFVTSLTVGQQWLSDTTPGKSVSAPPTAAGSVVQKVGNASAANMLHVQLGPAYKI